MGRERWLWKSSDREKRWLKNKLARREASSVSSTVTWKTAIESVKDATVLWPATSLIADERVSAVAFFTRRLLVNLYKSTLITPWIYRCIYYEIFATLEDSELPVIRVLSQPVHSSNTCLTHMFNGPLSGSTGTGTGTWMSRYQKV